MDDLIRQAKVILWKVMHFRWIAIAVTTLIMLVGWSTVLLLPNQYQVRSMVYVDTESMLKPLLKGLAVDDTVKEQAAIMMRRTLLSRPNIEKVILQADLDLTVENDKQMERLVDTLANTISISGHADRRRPDANLYRVTFTHQNPQTAYEVVDAVLDVFLESTLGIARQGTSTASKFMSQQIADYKARLEAADEAVKDFNLSHAGLLPDQQSSFYNRLATTKSTLEEVRLDQKELEFKVQRITSQLKGVNKETTAATVARNDRSLSSRISEMELQLRELRVHFTDDHPDVKATLAAIEGLTAQLNEKNTDEQDDQDNDAVIENPVYQELSVLLGATEAELAVLNARVGEYENRLENLQSQAETIPLIEAEYTALVRDYDVIADTYQQLVKRKESAAISGDADRSGETVQFRVIEPPTVPLNPTGPNRPLFLLAVLGAGLAAGVGLAVLLAEVKGAIYSKEKLIEIIPAPVLGEVSMTWNLDQLRRRRRDIIGIITTAIAILASFSALLYYQMFVVGLPIG